MKRVLLIGPITNWNAGEWNWSAPPLGIHRLAAYLNSNHHYAEVWDCNIQSDLEGKMKEGWDIIGFSVLQSTLHNDIKAMWKAKEICPNAMLIVGGIEATLNYQDIFDNSPVRIVILAEGEEQLLCLADGEAPETISGAIVKTEAEGITDDKLWDYLNLLDFTKMGYDKYWETMRAKHPKDYDEEGGDTVRFVTSTHCNRGCTFCSVTLWHKFACGKILKPAVLNAEQVWKLTQKAKSQLPSLKSIYFVEDDFMQDRNRVWEYFRLIMEEGPQLRFQVQTHTSRLIKDGKVDIELLQHMKNAGVEHITMGVENTCEHCLKSFRKLQRLDVVPDIIKECKKLGIRPYILIILFPASSTRQCLQTNYDTLSKWLEYGATISIEPNLMSYKGAPLYNSAHEQLYTVCDIDDRHRLRYPIRILPDDLEARAIQAKFNELWPTYLKSKHIEHTYKGETGKVMIELLGKILRGEV